MPEMNFIQAINTALAEELRLDPKTFLMDWMSGLARSAQPVV